MGVGLWSLDMGFGWMFNDLQFGLDTFNFRSRVIVC